MASLPHWLPGAVVALRSRIFTRINGGEGIAIPGDLVDAAHFKEVYSHPAAIGRSRGAARWETLSARTANHIPFGVTANRPCPAKGLAPVTMYMVWDARRQRPCTRHFAAHEATELSSQSGRARKIPTRDGSDAIVRRSPVGTNPSRW